MTLSHRAQAAAWYAILTTSPDAVTRWPAFRIWLNLCEENRQALREVEDLARGVSCAQRPHGDGASGHNESNVQLQVTPEYIYVSARRQTNKRQLFLSAFMIAWLPLVPVFKPATEIETHVATAATTSAWSRYETGLYELPRTVVLPDQSSIQMDGNTIIDFRLGAERREFALERGRALFTVSHDPRPLEVKVGATAVVAVGTVFSVGRDDHDELLTIVKRGEVLVIPRTSHSTLLSAGEAARVSDDQVRMEANLAPADDRLMWERGVFNFKNTPLSQAVVAFNRYNKRQLKIVDPRIADARIGGQFLANDPDGFARALYELGIVSIVVGSNSNTDVIFLREPVHR